MKKMRVICSLILCSAMTFTLFGCSDGSSDNKKDKKDNKKTEEVDDEADEDEDSDSDDNNGTGSGSASGGSENSKEDGNELIADSEAQTVGTVTTNDKDSRYSFEGMDPEQIVDLVYEIATLKEGLTIDEIVADYDYEPTRVFNHCISFNTDEYNNWFDIPDCIISANYSCDVDDNGVWLFEDDVSFVAIEFHISDDKIAKAVYYLLYDRIDSYTDAERIDAFDGEEYVDWTVNFYEEGEEMSKNYIWMMRHSGEAGGYHFYVTLPIFVE